MRQAFIQFPWVHAPSSSAFSSIFRNEGRYQRLDKGQTIYNGGIDGEVAWVLSGLFAFRMQDARDKEHYFTLVPEGRMIGNVDAYTASVVNIIDLALRPSEVLLLPRRRFIELLHDDRALADENTESLIREHESDLEGMFSCMTDPLEVRIAKLFASLVLRNENRDDFNWPQARSSFKPTPVPFDLMTTEIAKTVNATRSAVSIALSRFENEGLVKRRAGKRIIMPELLNKASDWLTDKGGPTPAGTIAPRKRI